jgi:DNA (cytosine-5)-methyltransferase 1
MKNKRLTSIELFTGAGGLALGLHASGWEHAALVEKNTHACSTILLNGKSGNNAARNWHLHSADVREIQYTSLGVPDVDMIAGGPPCQPFSLGGKHKAYRDERDMFPEAVRAVREMKPKCFLFENVKGLVRESFSTYFNYIVLQLTYPEITKKIDEEWTHHLSRLEKNHIRGTHQDLSYRVIYRLLNAADYGIPQHRYRVFIVGFRSDLETEWAFPEPTHGVDRLLWDQWVSGDYWDEHKVAKKHRPLLPKKHKKQVTQLSSEFSTSPPKEERYRTVRDALKGLPNPETHTHDFTNHEFRSGAKPYPGHTGSSLDEPSKALKAGDHGVPGGENMIAFNDGRYRYYTIRESARIQTFPDDYAFSGSWTECMRQIGNAVPVQLASVVGNSIRKQMV